MSKCSRIVWSGKDLEIGGRICKSQWWKSELGNAKKKKKMLRNLEVTSGFCFSVHRGCVCDGCFEVSATFKHVVVGECFFISCTLTLFFVPSGMETMNKNNRGQGFFWF